MDSPSSEFKRVLTLKNVAAFKKGVKIVNSTAFATASKSNRKPST